MRKTAAIVGTTGLVLGILTAGQGIASAAPATANGTSTCTGTITSPGELTGTYNNLVITGACVVQDGTVHVLGNLTVARGADLTAIFGEDDLTHSGNSNLYVGGNLYVDQGASVMLGCYSLIVNLWTSATATSNVPDFPCYDDQNQNAPTLNTYDVVAGNVIANDPLGLIMHQDTVDGNVIQNGGGAGLGCQNVGIFNQYFGLPDYSDFSNNIVHGNMLLTNMDTCWNGFLRNVVSGNMSVSDNTSTGDGTEVGANIVYGNMTCDNNNPAVQTGDSNTTPNKVGGNAFGQCGFGVIIPNPSPEAGVTVPPTYQPASVPLY